VIAPCLCCGLVHEAEVSTTCEFRRWLSMETDQLIPSTLEASDMPSKKKPVVDPESKNPPDSQVLKLQEIARAAGDEELVKLCTAAINDYASAREAILREIAYGPHAEAFKAAILAS
jgi:hypothetical protein